MTRQLERFGTVKRTGGQDAISNAIEFARYRSGTFGWGVTTPGHGMVFMRSGRPLFAAAAAPLSGAGSYGPLFLLDSSTRLPQGLQSQLLDTQPAYRTDPVAGVYNHGWIIGTTDSVSVLEQARIDALLEIVQEQLPGNLDDVQRVRLAAAGKVLAMSQAEHPDRARPDHDVTLADVRQLMGASTPHFALQLRNRIAKLIRGLPAEHPARVEASARSAASPSSASTARFAAMPRSRAWRRWIP